MLEVKITPQVLKVERGELLAAQFQSLLETSSACIQEVQEATVMVA